jgi:4-hydroxy-3-polyprenylbenzoate decarboxylase
MNNKKRILVGISGASGTILGAEVLKALHSFENIETHLVITSVAEQTLKIETGYSVPDLIASTDFCHPIDKLSASIASGSFDLSGMVIVPCSMKTVAGIASGYSDNLLLRAADVCLKERRKLVICPRETPFNGIHLRNLLYLHDQGVVILPAMMTFYHNPATLSDMINQFVGKVLSQFNLPFTNYQTWNGISNDAPENDVSR